MIRFILSLFIFAISTPALAGLYVAPQSLEQDNSGFSCSGCLLYFYTEGTTTPKDTYQEKALTTPHTNPVVADSAGRFDPIYMDGLYKVILKDSAGVTIWSEDNYSTGASSDFFGETETITATTAIDSTYEKKHLRITNTVSLNLLSVATAGEGFQLSLINDGTGIVTIDPSASEQVNDLTTFKVQPKGSGILISNGSEWSYIDSMGTSQTTPATGDILAYGTNIHDWVTTLSGDYTFSGDNILSGDVKFPDEGELTIATGAITVTAVNHTVDTESDAATDDLDTITGGNDGQILIIRAENTARTVVIKDGTGNIETPDGTDILLDSTEKTITLEYDAALTKWLVASSPSLGKVVQIVSTLDSAVATGTTNIPYDDTIPQITEGDEYMTVAITPKFATSTLIIDVTFNYAQTGAGSETSVALFQDSTANALAAVVQTVDTTNYSHQLTFRHTMTSGTTSSTTFRVRAGDNATETLTFNGVGGARIFGGVMASSITVTELY